MLKYSCTGWRKQGRVSWEVLDCKMSATFHMTAEANAVCGVRSADASCSRLKKAGDCVRRCRIWCKMQDPEYPLSL